MDGDELLSENFEKDKEKFLREEENNKTRSQNTLITKLKDEKNEKKVQTNLEQVIDGFNIKKRWAAISVSKRVSSDSAAFDLIRVLSMTWVVMAHNFSNGIWASTNVAD